MRFTMRRMMLAMAVVALLLAAWEAWFDPVRRWRREVTDDQDGAVRWRAIEQMASGKGGVNRATALATLIDALRSPSHRVRETAAAGLLRLGPEARPAASSLLATLADPRPHIRAMVAGQLGSVLPPGDPGRNDAVPALTRLLGDRSPEVRQRAASTLAEFGRREIALPVLIESLREPDYLIRVYALWSIERIGPRAASDALAEVVALESRVKGLVAPTCPASSASTRPGPATNSATASPPSPRSVPSPRTPTPNSPEKPAGPCRACPRRIRTRSRSSTPSTLFWFVMSEGSGWPHLILEDGSPHLEGRIDPESAGRRVFVVLAFMR